MVDLPKKKVGIVACSGEELAEGTVTRLAALKVLEKLRPADTVTICLPLFLAGGEGDRAFARFYPTIAVDGCELRCAARATEMYSGKPAASLVVRELIADQDVGSIAGVRQLNLAGQQAVDITADRMSQVVDDLLGKRWDRRSGEPVDAMQPDLALPVVEVQTEVQATCSCGSGIPIQKVTVNGNVVTVLGLPLILQQFREAGKAPSDTVLTELYSTVKIYNAVPAGEDEAYSAAIAREYQVYWDKELQQ